MSSKSQPIYDLHSTGAEHVNSKCAERISCKCFNLRNIDF